MANDVWKDVGLGIALGGVALVGLLWSDAPTWLQVVAGLIALLATLFPVLPFAVLLPWHFVARRRGLMPRSNEPTALRVEADALIITHRGKTTRIALDEVTRVRDARNDNWTESRMLADALTLYGAKPVRVPLDADGIDTLISTLQRRNVPIEYVLISAPTVVD